MPTTTLPGRFIWHELMTSDPAAAVPFYQALVGWGSTPWGNDGNYTLWMNGKAPVGGLMLLPAQAKAMGAPPHWLTYVSTPDADATAKRAEQLGARILKPAEDVPTVGRFVVLADPQGAVFALYQPAGDMPRDGKPEPGGFSWHELATTDREGAFAFYSALFGWVKAGDIDMGTAGVYQMYGLGEAPMGGIYKKPAEMPVPNWLPYAVVTSADTAATTASAKGGKVILGPMEIPGGDRITVLTDPQGAAFAVHSVKPQ